MSNKFSNKIKNPGTPYQCHTPPVPIPPIPPGLTGTWIIEPPINDAPPWMPITFTAKGDCNEVEDATEIETIYTFLGGDLPGPNPTLDNQEFNIDLETPGDPGDYLLTVRWVYPGLGFHEETAIVRVF